MRRVWTSLLLAAPVIGGSVPACAEAPISKTSCEKDIPRIPMGDLTSKPAAVDLLGSVTQLLSPLGKPVLRSNFGTAVAINNKASLAQRAQALHDALVTDANSYTLADGLGERMGGIYRDAAVYQSEDDGKTLSKVGQVGPAVATLIRAAVRTAGTDSAELKCAYANGVEPFQVATFSLPLQGTYDVFGKSYGREPGTPGADKYGNPRPFQTAPLDAASGPRIETYQGIDFFGVAADSRIDLLGASPEDEEMQGRTGSDLRNSPSYPSGHTTFGYTGALVLAMMVPERYRALVYRASEYGNSRIVLGAHYPLDVIGGRTLATYDLAQALAGRKGYPAKSTGASFRTTLNAGALELRALLKQGGCPDIAACAEHDPVARADQAAILADGRLQRAQISEAYAFRLNYRLTPMGAVDLPPEPVPEAAGFLLETRFPYLTPAQRREVLRTTEGPSGYFLDVSPLDGKPLAQTARGPAGEASAYSRLDLFAASGGYASLADQVVVEQEPSADPNLKPFENLARADIWTNDIAGPGGLTKRGRGRLTLAGTCTYALPTIVDGGTLEVAGSISSTARVEKGGTLAGTGRVGDVAIAAGGSLAPGKAGGSGALDIAGSLSFAAGGTLAVRDGASDAKVRVAGKASLDGAILDLTQGATLKPGTSITLLTAEGGVSGTFTRVRAETPDLVPNLTYAAKAVYLTLDAVSER